MLSASINTTGRRSCQLDHSSTSRHYTSCQWVPNPIRAINVLAIVSSLSPGPRANTRLRCWPISPAQPQRPCSPKGYPTSRFHAPQHRGITVMQASPFVHTFVRIQMCSPHVAYAPGLMFVRCSRRPRGGGSEQLVGRATQLSNRETESNEQCCWAAARSPINLARGRMYMSRSSPGAPSFVLRSRGRTSIESRRCPG